MLQWMGGSRQKMSTSRRSTQKRQKQYFEQRKRQQQNQNVGAESYADGGQTCEQLQKEQRSLDVLNLQNLSTIAQEWRSSSSTETNDPGINSLKTKCSHLGGPPAFLNNKVNTAHSTEIKQAETLSDYKEETVIPNVVFSNADEGYNNTFNFNDSKEHFHKAADKQPQGQEQDTELSIFELLGDGRQTDNSDQSHINETHAAFSIEGLGNVGTRTPVHSPPQSGSACFPRWKTSGHQNPSKSFACVLDDLELEMDTSLPSLGNSFCFSSDMEDSKGNWNQNLSTYRDRIQFDVHGSNINSRFDDSQNLYSVGNNNKDAWHCGSHFQDDDYLNEREDDLAFKYRDHEMSDYTFQVSGPLKKRDHTRAAEKFNILGPSASELQKSGKNHDFMSSSDRRHPMGNENFDFRDVTYQPDLSCFANEDAKWSYFANEDARDNLSLLSVESCSSTAVRGEEIDSSPSKSSVTQSRRHGPPFRSPSSTYGLKKNWTTEFQFENMDNILQSNKASGSRKYRTNVAKSKRHHRKNSPFQEKPRSPESWLLRDGYTTDALHSGFHSFRQSPETKLPSSRSKLFTEDPFDASPVSEFHINAKSKSSLHRSKHGEATECSPSHSFVSEKFSFGQTFSPINCHDSPIFSNTGFGLAKRDSSPGTGFDSIFRDPSHVAASHGKTPSANLSGQGSVNRDEEHVNCRQSEPGKQSNSVSEKEEAINDSNSYDSSLECNNANNRTLEQKETLETAALPEHSGEASSSSVKITTELKCSIDEKEYNHVAGISDARREVHTGPHLNSDSQVMMLESYVLQLLCVQKVEEIGYNTTLKNINK